MKIKVSMLAIFVYREALRFIPSLSQLNFYLNTFFVALLSEPWFQLQTLTTAIAGFWTRAHRGPRAP